MKKNQKVYDRDFKQKAVLMSYQGDSIEKVEQELNITRSLLNRWRQDYIKYGEGSFSGCGNLRLSPEQKKLYLLEKRIEKAQLGCTIIKNGTCYLSGGRSTVYPYIQSCEKICSAKQICQLLGVDQRAYGRWKNQYISPGKMQKLILITEIKTVFLAMKKRYGYMRIAVELRKMGYKISNSKTARYMREAGLYVCIKKP